MSFLSVEPQSKVILESHSNSLLAQIDTQVEIIADRYLAFFQERRRIETTYIESLQKLHRKAKTVDASFDPRLEPTTTRAAWDTVRDNLEREANTQQNFVDILDNDVIKPLVALEKGENGLRILVEEELRATATKYTDFSENKILELQQAYSNKYHHRLRGLREHVCEPEAAKSEEVLNDDCRSAVSQLNNLRSIRAEVLGDGYHFLELFVFEPIVENILVKYLDSMSATYTKYDSLVASTRAGVKKALAGTDTSDLRASFDRTLSFSIPPLALYRNNRPGAYSDLIFGVPLVDLDTDQENVSKVMRMCIEEVEKRGLKTNKIYSVGSIDDAEVLQLRRRFEIEKTFSFSSKDNIHSVAMLLKLYLWDLPEPLITFSMRDYESYRQERADNNFSVLRSKIRELHPVHRATLGALLRHLLRVSSHSDKNAMTVEELVSQFFSFVLQGTILRHEGVSVKALIMDDLIRHVHSLFDERHSPSPPALSSSVSHTSRKRERSIGSRSDGEQSRGVRLKQEPEV